MHEKTVHHEWGTGSYSMRSLVVSKEDLRKRLLLGFVVTALAPSFLVFMARAIAVVKVCVSMTIVSIPGTFIMLRLVLDDRGWRTGVPPRPLPLLPLLPRPWPRPRTSRFITATAIPVAFPLRRGSTSVRRRLRATPISVPSWRSPWHCPTWMTGRAGRCMTFNKHALLVNPSKTLCRIHDRDSSSR